MSAFSKIKRFLFVIVGLLLAIVVGIAAKQATHKLIKSANAAPVSLTALAKAGAEEMNKDAPKIVADGIRLDKASAEGSLIVISYTYTNFAAASMDVGRMQTTGSAELVRAVCGSPDLSPSIRKGISFLYRYHGKDGKVAYEKVVTSATCGF